MTEAKTAQAMGVIENGIARMNNLGVGKVLTVVDGLTEAEVHEAAALLEKSREVCEIPKLPQDFSTDAGYTYDVYKCGNLSYYTNIRERPNYCPSCGRKVVVK